MRDARAAWLGEGPLAFARPERLAWPGALREAFPGSLRLREHWRGSGAAFARYRVGEARLFAKYLPAGERSRRHYRRLEREIEYLRDLAPLTDLPHAPLRHWALDRAHCRAHLITTDLTDETYGWGHFTTDPEREAALHEIVRLLARFHAAWAGHRALRGEWEWKPERAARAAQRVGERARGPYAAAVAGLAGALPELLRAAPHWTLVHGDIHSGQVLWPRESGGLGSPILIDYGQLHPSVLGEDLAHLLGTRLETPERRRLGPALRASYRAALAGAGLPLTDAEWEAQERAGLALNILSLSEQRRRGGETDLTPVLGRALEAWDELGT